MSGTGQAQAPAAARVVSAFKAAPARSAAGVTNLERSLTLIQDAIARNKRELTALLADGKERRMARSRRTRRRGRRHGKSHRQDSEID